VNWFVVFLFLHITAAVIAFGPIFVFPLSGVLAEKHPEHLSFAMELDHRVGSWLVVPVALTMPVSGVGLLISAHINVLRTTYLLVAITLYIVAMALAIGLQLPGGKRLVALTSGGDSTSPPVGEAQRLIARARNVGIVLTLLFLAVILLMIVKPGGVVAGPLFG
jgi:hypothetical protein